MPGPAGSSRCEPTAASLDLPRRLRKLDNFDFLLLDALWDGLDRVDSHFWQVEELDACARAPKAENGPGGGSGDGNELPATGRPFRVLGQHRGTGAPANLNAWCEL